MRRPDELSRHNESPRLAVPVLERLLFTRGCGLESHSSRQLELDSTTNGPLSTTATIVILDFLKPCHKTNHYLVFVGRDIRSGRLTIAIARASVPDGNIEGEFQCQTSPKE
jgi:hypothetical protein